MKIFILIKIFNVIYSKIKMISLLNKIHKKRLLIKLDCWVNSWNKIQIEDRVWSKSKMEAKLIC